MYSVDYSDDLKKQCCKNDSQNMTKSSGIHSSKELKTSIKTGKNVEKCKSKRPDKPLYVPRALRSTQGTEGENQDILCGLENFTVGSCQKEKTIRKSPCITESPLFFSAGDSSLKKPALNINYESINTDVHMKPLKHIPTSISDKTVISQLIPCSSPPNVETEITVKPIKVTTDTNERVSSVSNDNKTSNATQNICNTIEMDDSLKDDNQCITISCNKHPSAILSKNHDAQETKPTGLNYNWSNTFDSSSNVTVFNESDTWDSMFNDQGECLNPVTLKELTDVIGNTQAHLAKNNYCEFNNQEECEIKNGIEEFSHIVELHGFPKEFSTQDLVSALSNFKSENFTIKWVDDTHALAIFSTPFAANQALCLEHPFIKIRSLSQGLHASRLRAKKLADFLEPAKSRPATSATLARRLVTSALGLKVHVPKEQREKERKKILEAKAQRQEAARQRKDMWDGVIS